MRSQASAVACARNKKPRLLRKLPQNEPATFRATRFLHLTTAFGGIRMHRTGPPTQQIQHVLLIVTMYERIRPKDKAKQIRPHNARVFLARPAASSSRIACHKLSKTGGILLPTAAKISCPGVCLEHIVARQSFETWPIEKQRPAAYLTLTKPISKTGFEPATFRF